jgi:hypothetical protein
MVPVRSQDSNVEQLAQIWYQSGQQRGTASPDMVPVRTAMWSN